MEIKKPVLNIPPELPEINLEKKKEDSSADKPAGVSSISDSIEAVKAKAQDFSEIVDRSTQGEGKTGEKELTSEQQNEVSKFNFNEELKGKNFFGEDGRSKFEDSKNSGLTPPFGKGEGNFSSPLLDRLHKLSQEDLARLSGDRFQEQTSKAVQDAEFLLQGGTLKEMLNNYLAEKSQDLSDMTGQQVGGSVLDRLKNLFDPLSEAVEPEGSAVPKGQSMFEDGSLGVDPTPAEVEAAKKKYAAEHPDNPPADKAAAPAKDPNEIKPPSVVDVLENILFGWATKESPLPTPPVPPDPETGKNMLDGFRAIFGSKDRTPESETKKGSGGVGMPDPENYHGKLPAELQGFMNYLRNQALALKPHVGGENELTDGNAGNTPISGPVDSLIVKQGMLGLLGQPDRTGETVHTSGSLTGTGSTSSGGAIDYGPDSDQVGYTGPTRTEDPGDIHFGPSAPLAQPPKTDESEDADDSSSTAFKFLQNLSRKKTED